MKSSDDLQGDQMTIGVFSQLTGDQAVLGTLKIFEPADALRHVLSDPLSIGRHGFVCLCPCSAVNTGRVYLKVNIFSKRSDSLRRLITGDPARRESNNLHRLSERGIPCGEVLARGHLTTISAGLLMSFMILREVEGTINLEESLLAGSFTQGPGRHSALEALGHEVGRLHKIGFIHHDLHFRNILVGSDTHGGAEFTFIDSPKGYWPRRQSKKRRGRIHDLACLIKHAPSDLSLREIAGFLRQYRGASASTRADRALLNTAARRAKILMGRRDNKLRETAARPLDHSRRKVEATRSFCAKIANRYGSNSAAITTSRE